MKIRLKTAALEHQYRNEKKKTVFVFLTNAFSVFKVKIFKYCT